MSAGITIEPGDLSKKALVALCNQKTDCLTITLELSGIDPTAAAQAAKAALTTQFAEDGPLCVGEAPLEWEFIGAEPIEGGIVLAFCFPDNRSVLRKKLWRNTGDGAGAIAEGSILVLKTETAGWHTEAAFTSSPGSWEPTVASAF